MGRISALGLANVRSLPFTVIAHSSLDTTMPPSCIQCAHEEVAYSWPLPCCQYPSHKHGMLGRPPFKIADNEPISVCAPLAGWLLPVILATLTFSQHQSKGFRLEFAVSRNPSSLPSIFDASERNDSSHCSYSHKEKTARR